ncbi:MAG: hypothetical protein WAM70_10740 [Pyrinomonadaceae bacterium]
MAERRNRSRKENRELSELYAERHKRIKDERKFFLNTLIGLSGGALVLSVTFLEKIAPRRHYIGLVIAAWCLLGVAVLLSVFGLVLMIWLSQRFQRQLEKMLEKEDESAPPFRSVSPQRLHRSSYGPGPGCWTLPEYWAGFFFVLGILTLTVFAIINLTSG